MKMVALAKATSFPDPVVNDLHPPAKFSGTDPDKCNSVPVSGVHIGLYFKSKT